MGSNEVIIAILSTLVLLSTISIQAYPNKGSNAFPTNSSKVIHPKRVQYSEGRNLYLTNKQSGERVAKWNKSMGINVEELGSYFQGDILQPVGTKRNGISNLNRRWPGGVIPYYIYSGFNPQQRQLILNAMEDYRRYTCIKFRPWNNDRDYIRILAGNTGCWSSVGRVGGPQDVNLQPPGCVYEKGTVVHELMHATGFWHEQSREDRDKYVAIYWQNIQNGYAYAFDIEKNTNTQNTPYDYHSVMHYSSRAFSKNGQYTILPRQKIQGELGQRFGFSQNDVTKINRLYGCATGRR